MALYGRHAPVRLNRNSGCPPAPVDGPILASLARSGTNPRSPSSTTSAVQPGPPPAFTPPVWLLYLCRALEAEIATCPYFQANALRQASAAATRRHANSRSIPPRPRKHRTHFHSSTTRPSRLTPATSTDLAFDTMSRGASGTKPGCEPDVEFHMRTRRRAGAAERPTTPASNPTPTKPPSSTDSSPLSSPPTSLGGSPTSVAATLTPPAKRRPQKRPRSWDPSTEDDGRASGAPPGKKTKPAADAAPDDRGDDASGWREPPKPPPPHLLDGAEARTRHRPAEQPTESAPSSPPKAIRGGGRGRGRGGRLANGAGRGRGRARDHGDRDDTPEPPPKKHLLTAEERSVVTSLRARQQELKRFFQVVGAQQNDLLDRLASREMAKLVKKPRAHKKVPEYDETMKAVEEAMERERDLCRLKYGMDVDVAKKQYAMEKELIEQRYTEHVNTVQQEHTKGLEGDIMLLAQATDAANDETRTETGSETDAFPMYHPLPEPGLVRGYNSTRIMDEKAFQRQGTTYNDQVRREVIDDDIITPMARALFEKNAVHQKDETKTKTMNMTALSDEAVKQLKEFPGYRAPCPMTTGEINSFALSALADAVDIMAQRYPPSNYGNVPLPPGPPFPARTLNFAPLPSMPQAVSQSGQQGIPPGMPHGLRPGAQHGVQQGIQPGVPYGIRPGVQHGVLQGIQPGVQHGIPLGVQQGIQPGTLQSVPPGIQQRRPPPSQQAQTFIFQPPQQFFNHHQQRMPPPPPPPPQPIPVTFVNSTISSRKSGSKGGQRILLPKM